MNDFKHRDEGCMILNTMIVAERFENTMMVGEWFVTQWLWVHDLKHRDGGWMICNPMIMEYGCMIWKYHDAECMIWNTIMMEKWFETQWWWVNDFKHNDGGWMIWNKMLAAVCVNWKVRYS